MLKGCWSVISGFLALIGLFFILKDCGAFKPPTSNQTIQPIEKRAVLNTLPNNLPSEPEKKLPVELPKYKVTARSGFTINLLVPINTPKEQLRALIFAFQEARINKSFAKLIPPTIKPWYNGPYSRIFIQIFDESHWATEERLKIVLGKSPWQGNLKEFNDNYNRHIRAEYVYETAKNNLWSETGCIGFSEIGFRSPDYEELFSKSMFQ